MSLDRKLAKEACLELWNRYHSKIEELGYEMSQGNMMHSTEEISIVATITPKYDREMYRVFREIIPTEFEYKGETFPVLVMAAVKDFLKF